MHEPPPPPIQVRDQASPVGKSISAVVILLAIIAGIIGFATILFAIVAFLFLAKPTPYDQFKTDMQKAEGRMREQVKELTREND